MREMLNGLMLTLAGVGLLAGGTPAESRTLHDAVRGRVLESIGSHRTVEGVRRALVRDPGFSALMEAHRRRALRAAGTHQEAEDAVQETLLKVWRARPEVFLQPHDAVARYLCSATRRNLATLVRRSRRPGTAGAEGGIDAALLAGTDATPEQEADAAELAAALTGRLEPVEADVLRAYLSGERSQRRIASSLGMTRHAVARATARIVEELRGLMPDAG